MRTLLAAGNGAVVFVDGIGGIGKTALLHQIAALGRAAGRTVFAFDGRAVAARPGAVLARLAAVVGADRDPLAALGELPAALFLVDDTDALAPLDRWARTEFLPRVRADAVVVLAGRGLPLTRWSGEPGWQNVLHSVVLKELDDRDARTLLRRTGLPEPIMAEALAFSRGHPLALTLVAGEYARHGEWAPPARAPALITELARSLVGPAPSAAHRAALDAAALAWVVTEPLLAAMIGVEDVHELFGWLRRRSCVEHGERGLWMHPLARDVLAAGLLWRDPGRHRELRRLAGVYYRDQLRGADPATRADASLDLALLHHA